MAEVRRNAGQSRFEMDTEAGLAFASYRDRGGVVAITHTEVPRALRGRGLGDLLVKGMLDMLRAEGRTVAPLCSFVATYIRRHPDYRELLG